MLAGMKAGDRWVNQGWGSIEALVKIKEGVGGVEGKKGMSRSFVDP